MKTVARQKLHGVFPTQTRTITIFRHSPRLKLFTPWLAAPAVCAGRDWPGLAAALWARLSGDTSRSSSQWREFRGTGPARGACSINSVC